MNLYFVLSGELKMVIWEDWFSYVGHEESYCIADLVLAQKPSQAKYLAWKNDKASFTGDFRDMPKMHYVTLARDLKADVPHIVTNEPEYQHYWEVTYGEKKQNEIPYYEGNAPTSSTHSRNWGLKALSLGMPHPPKMYSKP